MCAIKELSTIYWTDKQNGKTYATVSLTVRLSDGTTKSHECVCPTPVEEWTECTPTHDTWRKFKSPSPLVNKPPDHNHAQST